MGGANGVTAVSVESEFLNFSADKLTQLLGRIEKNPGLLRLPLVRAAKRVSMGHDEAAWNEMISTD